MTNGVSFSVWADLPDSHITEVTQEDEEEEELSIQEPIAEEEVASPEQPNLQKVSRISTQWPSF